MAFSLEKLIELMNSNEDEHLEFKEARDKYDFERLTEYCAALANEGSGLMILGVTDKKPRTVVGSQAFQDIERTAQGLVERLHLKVRASVVQHPDGRVVVFEVPPRPIGLPIQYNGKYWMRAGESLVSMTNDMLKNIFDETEPDFSATICPKASISDLVPDAIEELRQKWSRKSGNQNLSNRSPEHLLADAELIIDGGLTYAALILLGSTGALTKYLAQSELVFEYRSGDSSGAAQQRIDFREGYFLYHNRLWDVINLRNDLQHFHEGLFVRDIRTFNEIAMREVVQNAIAHRDYRLAGSIFVRQYPRRIEVVSPGGFPAGITLQNILWRQAPRNRRIAETLAKCGLVERSGQGVNIMFEECIKEGKPRPDFTGTDAYQVSVTLQGVVRDPRFIRFLDQIGQKTLSTFATEDFLLLDAIYEELVMPEELKSRIPNLIRLGVIERFGHGKGTRHILSRKFYGFIGKKGAYTRKRGLNRNTNKALLQKHIEENAKSGSRLAELRQVLPDLTVFQIQTLLRELKADGHIHSIGHTKAARWYPGPKSG